MLIMILVFSNLFLTPAFAKEPSNFEAKEVNLYTSESDEELILYKDKERREELNHVQNNSPELLLEQNEETNSSLVEIETSNGENIVGYIQNKIIVVGEVEELKEYKLYTDKVAERIQIYTD